MRSVAADYARLILDGTVVRVRVDRQVTAISLLVMLGVRADGQKIFLSCATWAARARRRGARCSTTFSNAA
jgi:transposase-like protein